jgi:hypothetical protein
VRAFEVRLIRLGPDVITCHGAAAKDYVCK